MSDVLKAISSGVATFVFAWILPSALAVTSFVLVCKNVGASSPLFSGFADASGNAQFLEAALFGLVVLSLATLLAYSSLIIYRVLEGYLLPQPLKNWLLSRTRRHWHRLRATRATLNRLQRDTSEVDEELHGYPVDPALLLPTRLGNALKASETFGLTRFGLNSQQLWYELRSVTSETVRSDVAQTRAVVDLFVSLVAHLSILGFASLTVGVWYGATGPLLLAILAVGCIRPAYQGAVRNMLDWQYAMQAMVNLGRNSLAGALGFSLPHTFETERWMWNSLYWKLERDDKEQEAHLNRFRIRFPDTDSDYVATMRAIYMTENAPLTASESPDSAHTGSE